MTSLALIAIGFGLAFPRLEGLLEGPFSRIPRNPITSRSNVSRRSDHRH